MFTVRTFDPRNISWWHMEKDQIDFEPLYQRKGKLWNARDKAFLIDSIINRFDIPKIYIADFTFSSANTAELNPTRKSYAIIDGKQRLEAIFDFIENKVTLNEDFVYLDDKTLKLGGLNYRDLKSKHPKIASKFDNFPLSVMSVITDQEGMINELFIRLNNSKPLTGSELRNAMKGLVPKLIGEIAEHSFFKQNIRFTIARAQDLNTAAKLLLIEFRGKFVNIKKVDLDRFVLEAQDAETSNFKSAELRASFTLALMNKSFGEKDSLLKNSGVVPVYYWLFRTYKEEYKAVRPFLVDFEARRMEYLKRQKSSGFKSPSALKSLKNDVINGVSEVYINQTILKTFEIDFNDLSHTMNYEQYQNGLRNPNDQSGLQSVYEALEREFITYTRGQASLFKPI